jgi:hypothetical protein
MNNDYETVIAGFFDFLTDQTPSFQYRSRRLKQWTDVATFPALFLRQIGADDEYPTTIFARTTLDVELWLYTRVGVDPNAAASADLNALVEEVRDAMLPDDPSGRFTIGGLSAWCRVEGRTEYDPGDLDTYGKALLPVKILLP